MPVSLGAQEGWWELLWKDLSWAKAKQKNLDAWILWHLISVQTTEASVVSGVITFLQADLPCHCPVQDEVEHIKRCLGPGALQCQLLVLQAATLSSDHRQESQTLGLHCDHTEGNIEKGMTHVLRLLWLSGLLECQLSDMLRNSWCGLNVMEDSRKSEKAH